MPNPFASLTTTDATSLPGATVAQDLERLDLDLGAARVSVSRDAAGAVRVAIHGASRVDLRFHPEAAVRLGSHLAALGAETLAERQEPAA